MRAVNVLLSSRPAIARSQYTSLHLLERDAPTGVELLERLPQDSEKPAIGAERQRFCVGILKRHHRRNGFTALGEYHGLTPRVLNCPSKFRMVCRHFDRFHSVTLFPAIHTCSRFFTPTAAI
jgi:hypothetical protein